MLTDTRLGLLRSHHHTRCALREMPPEPPHCYCIRAVREAISELTRIPGNIYAKNVRY